MGATPTGASSICHGLPRDALRLRTHGQPQLELTAYLWHLSAPRTSRDELRLLLDVKPLVDNKVIIPRAVFTRAYGSLGLNVCMVVENKGHNVCNSLLVSESLVSSIFAAKATCMINNQGRDINIRRGWQGRDQSIRRLLQERLQDIYVVVRHDRVRFPHALVEGLLCATGSHADAFFAGGSRKRS